MEVSQYMKEKETIEYLDLKHLVPFSESPVQTKERRRKGTAFAEHQNAGGAIEPLIVRPLSGKVNTRSYQDTEEWRLAKNSYRKDTCYRPQSDRRTGGFP